MAALVEWVKLASFIVGGMLLIGVGLYYQKRKQAQKQQEEAASSGQQQNASSGSMSQNETMAQQYIQQYKNTYPRDAIKQGLQGAGIQEQEAEQYLSKYY